MMARRGALQTLCSIATLLIGGCGMVGSRKSYRFRMTVEVETPDGSIEGTSAYEVTAWNEFGLDPSGKVRRLSINGHALLLELSGRTVYALMRTSGAYPDIDFPTMSMAALDPAFKNDWVESADRIASGDGVRSPAEVARKDWPLMVSYVDITNPTTVEVVDPDAIKVKRVLVETTKDSVGPAIGRRLPSFGATGFAEWYQSLPYGDPRGVRHEDFLRTDPQ